MCQAHAISIANKFMYAHALIANILFITLSTINMLQGKVFFIKIMVLVISQDIMMQIGLVVWMIRHSKSGYSVKSRSRISRYALPTRDMLFIHSLVQEMDFSVSMPRQLHHKNHVALHFKSRLTQTYKAHLVVSM